MGIRLAVALSGAAALAAPSLALAQPAGGSDRGLAWLWIVAAVLVVAALFALIFGKSRPEPPAHRPGGP